MLRRFWEAAEERKAQEIVALDLRGLSSVADYFLICSGTSEPHLKAIRDRLDEEARSLGTRPRTIEGFPESHWIVADFGPIIAHIFHPRTREYYGLEELWSDGKPWRPPSSDAATPSPGRGSTSGRG